MFEIIDRGDLKITAARLAFCTSAASRFNLPNYLIEQLILGVCDPERHLFWEMQNALQLLQLAGERRSAG